MSGQRRGSRVVGRLAEAGLDGVSRDVDPARRLALEERQLAARREKLLVRPDSPPFLRVEAPSGFSYRIHLRGGPGASTLQSAFDDAGLPLRPPAGDEAKLRHWIGPFMERVEPQALDWLDRRIERRPMAERCESG